jgi:hypothetical protein
MLVLMIGAAKRATKRGGSQAQGFHASTTASEGVDGSTHQWICVMGKKRWQVSEQTIFDDNPFLDGFFEWMDSSEGERATEVLDTLLDLMADVHVDPKQRRLVWPDAGQLTLQQSIEHIQKQCPDFSVEEIEGHLLYWIESGYGPDNCSEQQLEELENLSLQWVADHTRRAA